MNTSLPLKRIVAASLGAALLASGANALADPPSRIARLAYISGPVSFAPAGGNNWEYASLNRPLIPGDRLWVEPGARDELQVGGAALRMDGNTLVTLLNLDDRTTQLQLSQGRLNVRVRKLRPNDVFEIDTPNLALSIRQPGDYRIEVDPNGNATMVAVRRGQAEAYGDGNAYRLGSGQAYRFAGTDLRDVQYARPNLDDDFDRWSASRDRRVEQARSARYVSPDLIGYEDLDEGNWRVVPSYGNVWMPAHVGRDWAPYRNGHWSYVQPWGWTWVDDAPWGFAVCHYGRWARFPDGWGWVPGPRAASPVYAPALVVFISIGSGAFAQRERPVAWFPLAPREVYRPSYRASPTYITNINITNTTLNRYQIARGDDRVNYVNRQVGGAVTAVPATVFVRAQPVSKAALAVPVAALAGAAIAHAAPVSPERDGMRGRGNAGHQPPPAVMARQVLAKTPPPQALRHAPSPSVNVAGQAQVNVPPQAAAPAPRVLPQDRHGGGRQMREVPAQPPVAAGGPADVRGAQGMQGARPGAPQAMPPAMPQPNGGRFAPPGDARMNGAPRGAAQAPGQPVVPPLAHAPTPVPVPVPVQQSEHGRNRIQQPPATAVPAPGQAPQAEHGRQRMPPPPLAHAPTAMPQPPTTAVPAPGQAAQSEHGRNRMPPPPLAHAPTPIPPPSPMPQPLAQAPAPVGAPPVPSPDRAADARSRRDEMRQARENRDHSPRGLPPQAARPEPQAAAAAPPPPAPQPVPALHGAPTRAPSMAPPQAPQAFQSRPERQQHNAPQPAPSPPAAAPRAPEPPPLRHAPTPAPRPAEQPKPEPARAAPPPPPAPAAQQAQPAQPAPQHGHGNEGKKDEKRHRDHPEKE